MKLHTIHTGKFMLDGGAMFGVVPKSIWQKTNPANDNNMCPWNMRSLLIEDGNKLILIDTGIGNKQHESFFKFFFLHGNDSLDKSLNKLGFNRNDITKLFFEDMQFDHCGGAIEKVADKYIPAFKNANYWSNKNHWNWAIKPNAREKASFLQENILPIEQSGQLKFINVPETGYLTNSPLGFDILFVDGHTDKQMIPHIKVGDKTLVFCADLLPSTGHIPLPYVMGYDTRPLITLTEKEKFLNNALQNNFILFLEHDYYNDCCTLTATEKGPRLNQKFDLSEIF